MTLKRSAAITGIGEMRPSRSPDGKSTLGIWTEVAREAILDAGLTTPEIDGLLVAPPITEQAAMWPSILGEYLNIHPGYGNVVDLGGASACGMVWRAAAAIQSGLCRAVLCVTGEASDVETFYAPRAPRARRPVQQLPYREFEVPYGPMGVNSGYALIAMRHMHEHGTTGRQLAKIAVDQRTNACANPDALYYGKQITVDDVLASPLVVDPLHLLEIVRPCTGGAAIVVVAPDLAGAAPRAPVWLLGAAEASRGIMLSQFDTITTSPIAICAPRALEMAGVAHGDIDLISVYDCYTITVLITLEDAGFCPKGKGGPFVEEHDLTYAGDLPLNTHGGQLSFGQPGLAGGMSHVTEAVRQLQGRAGKRQVRDCELAFVNGNGGIMSEQVSLVLGT
ncbi:MAG: thiolase family protein [Dehalococcoidia bacterium]|nr:thiolase family protein [Dehalococcoidia bacterium]